MRRLEIKDCQPGDVAVVRSPGLVGDLIASFERELHPDYQDEFVPSHAFIVAYNGMVVESTAHGMASVGSLTEYTKLPCRVYRLERTSEQVELAIGTFLGLYAADGYGWIELLHFALEAWEKHLTKVNACNAVFEGYVCSQSALLFEQLYSSELWPLAAHVEDMDVLGLMMLCETHCSA